MCRKGFPNAPSHIANWSELKVGDRVIVLSPYTGSHWMPYPATVKGIRSTGDEGGAVCFKINGSVIRDWVLPEGFQQEFWLDHDTASENVLPDGKDIRGWAAAMRSVLRKHYKVRG